MLDEHGLKNETSKQDLAEGEEEIEKIKEELERDEVEEREAEV